MSEARIVSVRAGRVRMHPLPEWDRGERSTWRSAYGKDEVAGPVFVGALGLDGDEQAHLDVHGGPQMAVLAYAQAHYAHWREVPGLERMGPGGFAENLTLDGPFDEASVCIGDVIEAGGVVFEVSSPRGPCSAISRWWNEPSMVKRATEHARIGWYHRVKLEGLIEAGDTYRLVERPQPEWTIARVFRARVRPDRDAGELRALTTLPGLSPEWHGHFRHLLERA